MRIRTKLILLLAGAAVVTLFLASWIRMVLTRRQLEAQAYRHAHEVAEDCQRAIQSLPPSADESEFARLLNSLLTQHRSLASIDLDMIERHYKAVPGKPTEIRHGVGASEVRYWDPLRVARRSGGQRMIEVTIQVDPEGSRYGRLTSRTSLESVDRLIATQEMISLEVTAGAIVLLIIVTSIIADRVVVRPLALLSSGMKGVEEGVLTHRLPETELGRDEVATLVAGFNRMITRLAEADVEIRAFNQRLAAEVETATRDLQEKNAALDKLNRLLVETRRELGDKERLAALGQLAAQLAHEIGTPLGSISGHLQLASSSRDCTPALRDRIGLVIREVERIGKIVRDYLDSTRPAQPALHLSRLDRIVDEAIEIARSAKAGADPAIALSRNIADEVLTLWTDPSLLRQILVNLVANAFDAMQGSGAGAITVEATREAESVTVRVRDDGSGIAPDDLPRVFEPFYTTKGRGKGTGLGLAICKELAHALGGRISVESQVGQGSLFTLTLPYREQAPPAGEGASVRQSAA